MIDTRRERRVARPMGSCHDVRTFLYGIALSP